MSLRQRKTSPASRESIICHKVAMEFEFTRYRMTRQLQYVIICIYLQQQITATTRALHIPWGIVLCLNFPNGVIKL